MGAGVTIPRARGREGTRGDGSLSARPQLGSTPGGSFKNGLYFSLQKSRKKKKNQSKGNIKAFDSSTVWSRQPPGETKAGGPPPRRGFSARPLARDAFFSSNTPRTEPSGIPAAKLVPRPQGAAALSPRIPRGRAASPPPPPLLLWGGGAAPLPLARLSGAGDR